MSLAAPPAPAAPIPSKLLGTLTVGDEARYHFADGVYGFPGARAFALVPAGRPGLCWLQSAEDPALVFLLADPFHFFPEYAPDVPDAELAHLAGDAAAPSAADVALFAVITLPGDGAAHATANLRAPVLLDTAAGRGRQIVLGDASLAVRAPLALG